MNYIWILIIYFISINLLAFLNMKWDKNFAIMHQRRTSEKTLFTYALLLGAPGIYIGMKTFRHKTKHPKFTILIPFLIIINFICIFYIIKTIIEYLY